MRCYICDYGPGLESLYNDSVVTSPKPFQNHLLRTENGHVCKHCFDAMTDHMIYNDTYDLIPDPLTETEIMNDDISYARFDE